MLRHYARNADLVLLVSELGAHPILREPFLTLLGVPRGCA